MAKKYRLTMKEVVYKPLVYQDLIAEILVLIALFLLQFNIIIISAFLILIAYEFYHFIQSFKEKIVITDKMIILMNISEVNQKIDIKNIIVQKNVITDIKIEEGFRSKFMTIKTRTNTYEKDISYYFHFSSKKIRTTLARYEYKLTL
jgi:hypothetical protein